jgi:hypothetical protein
MTRAIKLLAVLLFLPVAAMAARQGGGGVSGGTSSLTPGSVNSSIVADNSLLAADLLVSGTAPTDGDVLSYDAASGGVRKLTPFTTYYEYIYLRSPDKVDGSGCVVFSTTTDRRYGAPTFSNSADETANYADYTYIVPRSFDSNVDLRLEDLAVRLSAADTGTHRYKLSIATVAVSATVDSPTFGSSVIIDITGDASGTTADLMLATGATTLTGWKSKFAAGRVVIIRLARDGNDSSDASTVDSSVLGFQIRYGVTHP